MLGYRNPSRSNFSLLRQKQAVLDPILVRRFIAIDVIFLQSTSVRTLLLAIGFRLEICD